MLSIRILTALVLIPLVLAALFLLPPRWFGVVVLCVMLVPRFGGHGAAAATSISLTFETVLLFWIVRRRLGLHVLAFGKR